VPVEKVQEILAGDTLPLAERRNMVYAGTAVTYGRGRALIVATGMQSELGKITRVLPSGGPTRPNSESRSAAAWQSASMSHRCERPTSTPRAAASTMAASERYLGGQVRANRLANQTFANRLRTAPERSRVHPFACAHLRMAVSERLCWRPIYARAISDRLRGVGQLHRLAHARGGGCEPRGVTGTGFGLKPAVHVTSVPDRVRPSDG
jgi:hypothetical protein